jgi:hypothetical protein
MSLMAGSKTGRLAGGELAGSGRRVGGTKWAHLGELLLGGGAFKKQQLRLGLPRWDEVIWGF